VKKLLKSVYICGSYHKIKTGVPLFGPPGYIMRMFPLIQCDLIIQGCR